MVLFMALQVPMVLLNMLGGVIAGIWLLWLGQWGVAFKALLITVFAAWVIGFALMPSLILAPLATWAEKRDLRFLLYITAGLGQGYTIAVMVIWSSYILVYFLRRAETIPMLPLVLCYYEVTTSPWAFLAAKDQQSDSNSNSVFHVFFLQVGCLISALGIWMAGWGPASAFLIMGCSMAVSWGVQMVIFHFQLKAERTQSPLSRLVSRFR